MTPVIYVLKATDLFSRFGFGDGELFDDLLGDHGFEDLDEDARSMSFSGEVIAQAVERFLLPVLPRTLEVQRWGSGLHNPIRAKTSLIGDDRGEDLEGYCAVVLASQVLDIAERARRDLRSRT